MIKYKIRQRTTKVNNSVGGESIEQKSKNCRKQ